MLILKLNFPLLPLLGEPPHLPFVTSVFLPKTVFWIFSVPDPSQTLWIGANESASGRAQNFQTRISSDHEGKLLWKLPNPAISAVDISLLFTKFSPGRSKSKEEMLGYKGHTYNPRCLLRILISLLKMQIQRWTDYMHTSKKNISQEQFRPQRISCRWWILEKWQLVRDMEYS